MLEPFGNSLWQNQKMLCEQFQMDYCMGIDEAGRGALAGPVVSAAVCFSKTVQPFFLDDSKKIQKKAREKMYQEIISKHVHIGIGIVSNHEIDQYNILQATKNSMKQAFSKCMESIEESNDLFFPLLVAVDGNASFSSTKKSCSTLSVIKGDGLISSIAAASIVAKVTRDSIMIKLHENYPDYGFSQHKGYGTKKHMEAIRSHGLTPYHRLSFSLRSFDGYH